MKVSSACLLLLMAAVGGVAAEEMLHTASVISDENDRILTPQDNRGGWVNPEDLTPMPQCIAQQDQSTWLSTMTECTGKRCTRHFGPLICTHHQWLTQLTCLSTGFSSNVIKGYLPYCSRSVLAKAQLYLWIRKYTGRTWLVDVGDANGLQYLSPASLAQGYAAVDVTYKAPTCLTGSVSALSMEPFRHLMASCSFTSTTRHTGNAARPWEYRDSLRSMIALDSETAGYDLTGSGIMYGDYFDKECFCGAFTIDPEKEPCSGPGQLDWTKERLWIHATCGPKSLPDNWKDQLKTTEFAYIPIEDWRWPTCVTDMPEHVTELQDQCATDACEIDSGGYCKVRRAVDRACFCNNISYDSCGGSCQIFETRIDYVKWLHGLCGSVQDWHGLPDNWRELAAPIPRDMVPWRWTVKPSKKSNTTPITRPGSTEKTVKCASNEWKFASFALVNMTPFFAAFIRRRTGLLWRPDPEDWVFTGISIAALQLLASWFNAFLVQITTGYGDVPVIQLMFLWCSMPRPAWLSILLIIVQPFDKIIFFAAASSLLAEMILQLLSSYYMIRTVSYGSEHNFYLGDMKNVERWGSAQNMYSGALMWLVVISVAFAFQLMQIAYMMNRSPGSDSPDLPKRLRSKQRKSADQIYKSRPSEGTSMMNSERGNYVGYGTLPGKCDNDGISRRPSVGLHAVGVVILLLLWIAQWRFWGGFIGLSSEDFCPPKLGILTAIWIAFLLPGASIGATL